MKYFLLVVLSIIVSNSSVFAKLRHPIAVPGFDLPDLYGCFHDCDPGKKVDSDARIVGGENARKGQIFYQAGLINNNFNIFGPFCSCIIYNKTTCITAGHCTVAIIPGETFIRYNTLKICLNFPNLKKTYDAQIKKVLRHPKYNDTTADNDIALVILEEPFIFDEAPNFADSIELYPENTEPEDDTILLASGWGLRQASDNFQPACLQIGKSRVFNRVECKALYGNSEDDLSLVNDRMICTLAGTQETYKGGCDGDSGGPLVLYKKGDVKLVGITSKGACGVPGAPEVYTLVTKFYDFILYYSG